MQVSNPGCFALGERNQKLSPEQSDAGKEFTEVILKFAAAQFLCALVQLINDNKCRNEIYEGMIREYSCQGTEVNECEFK